MFLQAYGVIVFLLNYALPVSVFVYCYGRIFYTIRRHNMVISGHAGHSQDVPMATTSRDAEQGQQQTIGAATSGTNNLSRIEMNVLHTMITIIVCFVICWSMADITNVLQHTGVSIRTSLKHNTHHALLQAAP